MDENTIKTPNNKFICPVCENEVTVPDDTQIGDIIECPACGEEFEVVEVKDGQTTVMPIEEEK